MILNKLSYLNIIKIFFKTRLEVINHNYNITISLSNVSVTKSLKFVNVYQKLYHFY